MANTPLPVKAWEVTMLLTHVRETRRMVPSATVVRTRWAAKSLGLTGHSPQLPEHVVAFRFGDRSKPVPDAFPVDRPELKH